MEARGVPGGGTGGQDRRHPGLREGGAAGGDQAAGARHADRRARPVRPRRGDAAGRCAARGARRTPAGERLPDDPSAAHATDPGIIGEAELALAKPSLRLLNTARGGIVDEFALAQALKEKRIAGAALDVYEIEPPESSPLLGIGSVIATPHIGAGTPEAQERAGQEAVQAVRLALTGQAVPGAVN
ncbi:hypothetical protein GXW82_09770 [Streptacidiphilus sp. 4-A2]|nr:hypothetical protein [Streptacidiphilus sp. 4-A2]